MALDYYIPSDHPVRFIDLLALPSDCSVEIVLTPMSTKGIRVVRIRTLWTGHVLTTHAVTPRDLSADSNPLLSLGLLVWKSTS